MFKFLFLATMSLAVMSLASVSSIAQSNLGTADSTYDSFFTVIICSGSNGCRTNDYGLGHERRTGNGDCHFHKSVSSLSGKAATFEIVELEGIIGNKDEFTIKVIDHHPSFPDPRVMKNIKVCGYTPDASDRRAELTVGVKYK